MLEGLRRFFRQYHNKILAITFISLGLGLFLGFYVAAEILSGWTYFRSAPREIINFVLLLITYGILLGTNINNSNYAYRGIYMFLVIAIFEGVFGALDIFLTLGNIFASGDGGSIASTLVYLALYGGLIGVGIALYIGTFNYMVGRRDNFKKLRTLYLIFVGILTASTVSMIVSFHLLGLLSSPINIIILLTNPISETLVAVGVAFTYERLRRI